LDAWHPSHDPDFRRTNVADTYQEELSRAKDRAGLSRPQFASPSVAPDVLWRSAMMRALPPLLIAVISLAWPSSTAAQSETVTGVVIDDRTGLSVPAVLVYVESRPFFANTDAQGRFALSLPPGDYDLVASMVGYALLRARVTVVEGSVVPVTFRLSEGAGTFTDRITVAGDRRVTPADAPGASTLHGRELENLRGVMLDDPLRAVQALPAATATDDFYSEFAVRGSSFRHVGLTVDGIPTRYLMHTVHGVTDGGSIAMINSETLGAVSLLPGSYPQTAGRALGAQVELTTREGNRDEFRGRTGLSGTSATLMAEGPLAGGRGSWLASARKSYLGYIIQRIDPEATFVFGFTDGQARIAYDVTPRHQLAFTTLVGRAAFEEGEEGLGVNDRADATSHAWLSSLSWRYTPGPRLTITNRLYSTGVEFDHDNPLGVTLDAARSHDIGWRADGAYTLGEGWLLSFGGDAQRLHGESHRERTFTTGTRVINDYSEQSAAASLYAQLRVDLGSRVSVTPGGRVDDWRLTRSRTASPWITAEARLNERLRLHGGTGIYRQFADMEQIFGLQGGGSTLRPERAAHADVGLDYRLTRDTHLTATIYSRREREVLWTPLAETQRVAVGAIRLGRTDAPWVNTLDGAARGVELVVRRDAPTGLSGWAGYAFARHRYTDRTTAEQFWADADQRHTLSVYGNYRLSSRSTVSAKLRYGSNYPIRGYVADAVPAPPVIDGQPLFYAIGGERNVVRLPPYARLDVRADRAFHWSGTRLVVFAEVANVLNRTNWRSTPYGVDRNGRAFDATESLMPIVPSAGFVVEF
jgi:hypothetical protein